MPHLTANTRVVPPHRRKPRRCQHEAFALAHEPQRPKPDCTSSSTNCSHLSKRLHGLDTSAGGHPLRSTGRFCGCPSWLFCQNESGTTLGNSKGIWTGCVRLDTFRSVFLLPDGRWFATVVLSSQHHAGCRRTRCVHKRSQLGAAPSNRLAANESSGRPCTFTEPRRERA